MRLLLLVFFVALTAALVDAQTCVDDEQRSCGETSLGECKLGTQICSNGEWGICQGAVYPEDEICFDSKDNNCDGTIDDNCECQTGQQRECGEFDKGICKKGTQTCENNKWGTCKGNLEPVVSDYCGDNLDNDCDGVIDNNCVKASCFDNIQNQNETGVDCGGPCPACKTETKILETCFDGIQNQDEEDIDCGGKCPSCREEEPIVEEPVAEPVEEDIEEPKSKTGLVSFGVFFLIIFIALYWYFAFKMKKKVKKTETKQDKGNIFSEKVELNDVKSKYGKSKAEEELDRLFKKR